MVYFIASLLDCSVTRLSRVVCLINFKLQRLMKEDYILPTYRFITVMLTTSFQLWFLAARAEFSVRHFSYNLLNQHQERARPNECAVVMGHSCCDPTSFEFSARVPRIVVNTPPWQFAQQLCGRPTTRHATGRYTYKWRHSLTVELSWPPR